LNFFLRWCLVIILMPFTSYASLLTTLWGSPPHDAIQGGNFVFHLYDIWKGNTNDRSYFYPYAGITYSGFNATYFKNTFNRDAFGVAIQRSLYNRQSDHTIFSMDYRVGILYGYCWGSFSCSNHATPVIPAAQLVVDYVYKNIGIELSYAGVVVSAGLVYYF
jgi:hypothetical protein